MKKIFKSIIGLTLLVIVSISAVGCSVLNDLKQKACIHKFNEEVVLDATCTTTGQLKKTCSRCGKIQIEIIPETHKNKVYEEGFSATCQKEGKTSGYQCSDCGYTQGLLDIDKLPHTDEDNNGLCDVCSMNVLDERKMVAVTPGISIANKWFRFYRGSSTGEFRYIPLNFNITFSNDASSSRVQFVICNYGSSYEKNFIFHSGPLYTIEGIEVYFYEEYVDIHFAEGVFDVVKGEELLGTITIDNSIVFEDQSNNLVNIYELVND